MKTENKTSLKKLMPLLLLALAFLVVIIIFYSFFKENSIKKCNNNENFSIKIEENAESGQIPAENEDFSPVSAPKKAEQTQFQNEPKIKEKKLILLPKNLEIPDCPETFSDAEDHEIVRHKAYSICYRESFEQAEYSSYMLDSGRLAKNSSRTENFRVDKDVSTGSAHQNDYKGSGYDRGHLSPAGDFTFDEEEMSESFFMSNMSPQAPGLNRGIWKDLESNVRQWAKDYGRIYVTSGPILEKNAENYKKIGSSSFVAVPEYFYKVVLIPIYKDEDDFSTPDDADEVFAMAFIFPNEKCSGTIWDYQVTVDEVEKRTGLDFFTKLEKETERKIESEMKRLD